MRPLQRGDIYHVSLDPVMGREQAGKRYVFVVTPAGFNKYGLPLTCAITQGGNFARMAGFAVSLSGVGLLSQGVVLCNQLRVLDISARQGRYIETAPDFIIDDVMARIRSIVD